MKIFISLLSIFLCSLFMGVTTKPDLEHYTLEIIRTENKLVLTENQKSKIDNANAKKEYNSILKEKEEKTYTELYTNYNDNSCLEE